MRLFLLFLIVPLIEIALFIQVGGAIGLGWTLLIVILTAVVGTVLVRNQGFAVLQKIRGSMQDLNDPTEPLAHGAMILFSGALLLTPGFFTDALGFSLLVPSVRVWLISSIRKRVRFEDFQPSGDREGFKDDVVVDTTYEDITPSNTSSKPSGWTRH